MDPPLDISCTGDLNSHISLPHIFVMLDISNEWLLVNSTLIYCCWIHFPLRNKALLLLVLLVCSLHFLTALNSIESPLLSREVIQSTVLQFTGLQSVIWSFLNCNRTKQKDLAATTGFCRSLKKSHKWNIYDILYLWYHFKHEHCHFCRLTPISSSHYFTSVPNTITPILRGCVQVGYVY